jgi:hypothetical protein
MVAIRVAPPSGCRRCNWRRNGSPARTESRDAFGGIFVLCPAKSGEALVARVLEKVVFF